MIAPAPYFLGAGIYILWIRHGQVFVPVIIIAQILLVACLVHIFSLRIEYMFGVVDVASLFSYVPSPLSLGEEVYSLTSLFMHHFRNTEASIAGGNSGVQNKGVISLI